MYEQEKINPYSASGEKSEQVESMFDHIAPSYDKLNHRLSWNIDKGWRKRAVRQLETLHPETVLDIATGTGDFAILTARMLPPRSVTGADISEGMMEVGRRKVSAEGLSSTIHFQREDCLHLSFGDNTFDAVTSAFGIRNFSDLEQGLREMCRVLRPGGQASILELSHPVTFPMKQLFSIYSHTFLPLYGRLISHDSRAYSYLTATIEAFPQGETMVDVFKRAGFSDATFKRLTFGICTMYLAIK